MLPGRGQHRKIIKLRADVTTAEPYVIDSGEFTINLNGHSITYEESLDLFQIFNSSTHVTFIDEVEGSHVTTNGVNVFYVDAEVR